MHLKRGLIVLLTTGLIFATTTNAKPIIDEIDGEIVIDTSPEIDPNYISLEEDEIDLIAKVVLGEAENQSELGKRLVADTILNRMNSERFPSSAHDVCYQAGQFGCLWNGRCNRVKVSDEIRELVKEEMKARSDESVLYFSSCGYNGAVPLFKEGAHYFSGGR